MSGIREAEYAFNWNRESCVSLAAGDDADKRSGAIDECAATGARGNRRSELQETEARSCAGNLIGGPYAEIIPSVADQVRPAELVTA